MNTTELLTIASAQLRRGSWSMIHTSGFLTLVLVIVLGTVFVSWRMLATEELTVTKGSEPDQG